MVKERDKKIKKKVIREEEGDEGRRAPSSQACNQNARLSVGCHNPLCFAAPHLAAVVASAATAGTASASGAAGGAVAAHVALL